MTSDRNVPAIRLFLQVHGLGVRKALPYTFSCHEAPPAPVFEPTNSNTVDVQYRGSQTAGQSARSDYPTPFPAHHVIANVYFVGSKELGIYLITNPPGHILVNAGLEASVPLIQQSGKTGLSIYGYQDFIDQPCPF